MIDVMKVAKLARINLSENEKEQLQPQLAQVVNFFNEISSINTSEVAPLITPVEMESALREDNAKSFDNREQALELAPEKSGNLYKVPPVV